MRKSIVLVLTLLSFIAELSAQTVGTGRKGDFSVFWGWNRGHFTKSDLHMKSGNSEFTLKAISAHDRQSGFGLDPYFNPVRISIPQTNLEIDYFISDKWELNLGFDHMKYVMDQDQTVKIDGNVNEHTYSDDDIVLDQDFLVYEHTDGLNYIYASAMRHFQGIQIEKAKLNSTWIIGAGGGPMRPRTDATFLKVKGPNDFHIAGYGFHAMAGISLVFFKHFAFRSEIKGGYINMPDIRPTVGVDDWASQKFWFFQRNFIIGATFSIK